MYAELERNVNCQIFILQKNSVNMLNGVFSYQCNNTPFNNTFVVKLIMRE